MTIKFRVQIPPDAEWSEWMTKAKEILKYPHILSLQLNETYSWDDPQWKQLAKELNECISPLSN